MSVQSDQSPDRSRAATPATAPAATPEPPGLSDRQPAVPAARAASAGPYRTAVGLHLVLLDSGLVLLGRRRNSSFADGWWHLPAGHLESGESVAEGMAREAREELGIGIDPAGLELLHVLHDLDEGENEGRLQLFFRTPAYTGRVENREPEKCHELRWWPLDGLPEPVVDYTARALREIAVGHRLSAAGWPA
ncbi:NUDIX domain-containing protein [Kitasatospora sp. NPDC057015]|uniref:NUDIX hydrolase n=1 Tax=Kitasatospora sp. NPDC057015 TaxID=3346001 RepID=UPI0036366519